MVEDVINHLVHLIEDKTKTWIEDVGGWKSFLLYVKKETSNIRRRVLTVFVKENIYKILFLTINVKTYSCIYHLSLTL